MLELAMTKKGWGNNGRNDDNIRSRSKSRERVALLGNSSSNHSPTSTKRRSRSRNGDAEMVSLLGGASPGKSKRSNSNNNNGSSYRRTRGRKGKFLIENRWTRSRFVKYLALLMITYLLTYKLLRKESKMIHWEEYNNILNPKGAQKNRCFEESKRSEASDAASSPDICTCPDPSKPLENGATVRWKSNHERMVSQARNAPGDLDIVFFGDGMVEQLSGSRDLGNEMLEGMEEYFERTFSRKRGGKFNALALGSSGDTGPNLLWHWENGIQQANLRPKLWFLMVGGNELYVDKCTDKFVKASILNLAKRIFEDQPDAKIVVHGIIPRKDDLDSKKNSLGHLWNRAQGVNLEVRKFIKTHSSRIYYMNLGQTLMSSSGGSRFRGKVDPLYMDGIYPTSKGMQKWGDLAVKKLGPILKGFDMKAHKENAKIEGAKLEDAKKQIENETKDGASNR